SLRISRSQNAFAASYLLARHRGLSDFNLVLSALRRTAHVRNFSSARPSRSPLAHFSPPWTSSRACAFLGGRLSSRHRSNLLRPKPHLRSVGMDLSGRP